MGEVCDQTDGLGHPCLPLSIETCHGSLMLGAGTSKSQVGCPSDHAVPYYRCRPLTQSPSELRCLARRVEVSTSESLDILQ